MSMTWVAKQEFLQASENLAIAEGEVMAAALDVRETLTTETGYKPVMIDQMFAAPDMLDPFTGEPINKN